MNSRCRNTECNRRARTAGRCAADVVALHTERRATLGVTNGCYLLPLFALVTVLGAGLLAQVPPPDQIAQERARADRELPLLTATLELRPGMTVADVGAGFGATSLTLAQWLGSSGRVFATDVAANQLAFIRSLVATQNLKNVEVRESATDSTNLDPACCDAIVMRDVYHHLTRPAPFLASAALALRSGGRLAVVDFVPESGSTVPSGVNPNRGGHGIRPDLVVGEVAEAGLLHERTIDPWPDTATGLYLLVFRKK